jgi:hypothetical protein
MANIVRGLMEVKVEDSLKKPLIQSRVMSMGEGRMPDEVIQELSDEHMKLFLREPDPGKWPPEMAHLREYLPPEERIKWEVYRIASGHDASLDDAFELWANKVSGALKDHPLIDKAGVRPAIDALKEYLGGKVEKYFDDACD